MRKKMVRMRLIGALGAFAVVLMASVISANVFAQQNQTDNLLAGDGSADNPYLIASADDWDALSYHINNEGTDYSGKYFKLTNDISVSTVLGNRPDSSTDSNDNYFSGTFDGGGHELNVNINESGFGAAPFAIAHNATIKNLHVTGTVTSGQNHATGLVAASKGRSINEASSLTIQNVTVSTDISCPSHVAGIVGHAHSADITMENVVFDGSMSASSVQGGMIGWGGLGNGEKYNASFKDCLFAGTYRSGAAFYPVAFANGQGTATLINDFYTTSLGSGGNPIPTTGDGQVKLFVATVEKDGAVNYFDNFAAATDSANWTVGSTLKLFTDVTTSSTINVPSGGRTLDLNGYGIRMTGSDRVMTVSSGATLNVIDSNDREHYLTLDNYHCTVVSNSGTESITGGSGVVKVTGGYITGGRSYSVGGGGILVLSGGTLVMNGGSVVGNIASLGCSGGGIRINGGGSVTLAGHTQVIYNHTQDWGGAIALDGTLAIKDNVAVKYNYGQSGIHDCGTLKLSGSPQILDNELYNHSGSQSGRGIRIESPLVFDAPLTDGASINVSLYQYQAGVFTSGWKAIMGDADPSKYFTSDDSNYAVILNNNGEAEIGVPPVASVISGDTTTNYNVISDAVNAWTSGSTLKLLADVTTDSTINVPSGEHALDLNGYALKAGSAGYSVITVGGGAELTIDDTSDNVGKITGGSVGQNYGGGVTVDGGTLTLKGGAISGNANTYGDIGNCGGGVHVRNSGKFYMEGGEISGNTSYVGGGVCTDTSATTVSITGGIIKNNKTERFGSAVWAGRNSSAVFRIGGDAEIIDNISTWTADKDGEGTLNFASALLVSGDPTVYGNWKTSGNSAPNTHINLDNAGNSVQVIELEGALTNDSGTPKITVTPLYRWNDLANGKSFVFTKNWSKYMGDADPADYFVCGNPAYKIFLNSSGEAEVGTPPVAHIINGETVTSYGSLSDALNAWSAGSTLKLLSDVTTNTSITVPSGEHTLDLNGYELKRTGATGADNSGLVITVNDGVNLTVTGPGKITGGSGFHGGGIHVEGNSSLVLDNCEISGNTGHYGGGLYLKNGTITLKNGTVVKENSATEGFGGSGIYAEGGGTLILEDSKFINNEIKNNNQYAVFLAGNANVKVSGAPVINDNTYGGKQKDLYLYQAGDQHSNVQVIGELTDGAKIIVGQTTGTGVIGSGWKANMGDVDPADYLVSADTDYVVFANKDDELEIGYPEITGVSAEGFEGDYDGKAHSITVSVPEGAIVKYGISEGSYTLTENPTFTNAGTYTVYYEVSKQNYSSVYGSAEVRIGKINATVTITGNTGRFDYDGSEHTVTGYTATADTALYDVTNGFTLSVPDKATLTNAGTAYMGLAPSLFVNADPNFATVTFIVTDGFVTVEPIDATVTITGNTGRFDYDGSEHTVTGYTASADTALYDVTNGFTLSGSAKAALTNAGTAYMGLAPSLFVNVDPNFKTVTFIVTDGFVTVDPVDAVVTRAPQANDQANSGSDMELLIAGIAEGGTFRYAIGVDPDSLPGDGSYSAAIPSASESGVYYIWYKVVSDGNHNDLAPVCLRVVIYESDWIILTGTVYRNDGVTPLENALVSVRSGNHTVDYTMTDAQGVYQFYLPAGVYGIVSEHDQIIETTMVPVYENLTHDVVMSDAMTESVLEVDSDDDAFGIAVGGLNKEAQTVRDTEQVPNDKSVSILMKVVWRTQGAAANAGSIIDAVKDKSLIFFDISIEKTVDSLTTSTDTTSNVLEIAVPYDKTAKRGIAVYCSDGSDLLAFTESDSGAAGTFRVDKDNEVVYIYTNRVSTFAIGYTPYYKVESDMKLGSFEGKVTVVITSDLDGSVYKLQNVSLSSVSFADIPKGQYTMTVTWLDGAENTLVIPLTIGGEAKASESVLNTADRNGAAVQRPAAVAYEINGFDIYIDNGLSDAYAVYPYIAAEDKHLIPETRSNSDKNTAYRKSKRVNLRL